MKTYLFLSNSTISILFWLLFLHVVAIFLESDVLIELLGTFIAFWDQVQTHTSDVFLGAEVLECVIRPIPVHFPGAIQSPNEA